VGGGEETVYLEEIQSDLHQAGRSKGYLSSEDIENLKQEKGEINSKLKDIEKKVDLQLDINGSHMSLQILIPELKHKNASEEDIQYVIWGKNRKEEIHKILTSEKIPNAPFKDTKAWAGLVFKRMVRWAAENNIDSVSWATGQDQIERYDFADVADEIRVKVIKPLAGFGEGENAYTLSTDKNGRRGFSQSGLSKKDLEGYIGFELTQKILEKEPNEEGYLVLSEEDGDLSLPEGNGMRYFYDQLIPSIANKMGKPYGV